MEPDQNINSHLILSGGNVITMEKPIVSKPLDIEIANGKIVALGEKGQLSCGRGSHARVIDVSGFTIMPGFVDSHQHMTKFGENLDQIDLSPSKVESIGVLVNRLRGSTSVRQNDSWIFGWGYDDTRLIEKRHPTREDLDRVSECRPICVMRTCLHIMVVNSVALKMAEITKGTPDPAGGRIGRFIDGEPNGILYEKGAMAFINKTIPAPSPRQCAQYLEKASRRYLSEGITCVQESGAGWWGNTHEIAGFQIASKTGSLRVRVSLGIKEDAHKILSEDGGLGFFSGFGNDLLWIGPAKFVTDGGIGQKTAFMREPFQNGGDIGHYLENQESLISRMERAHKAGFHLAVHAVGDKALELVLDAYEKVLAHETRPHRHRIEHATICPPDLLSKIKRLGLIVSVNPGFIFFLGDSWIKNLGKKRLNYIIPIRTLLTNGIMVAAGSDRPVTEGNPWRVISAAVNRTTQLGNEVCLKERISIEDALRLYTTNAAYANAIENKLGSISLNKFADVIVLDKNPLKIPADSLSDVNVLKTFVNGDEVYSQ